MPTIDSLNGGVAATAVTDDDTFVGNDGTTTKKFPATTLKTYTTAGPSSDIAALQASDAILSTNIATNTAAITTLTTNVNAMATSTTNLQTAHYTFTLADGQVPFRTVVMNVDTPCNLTIPPNATVPFPIGTTLQAEQWGTGATTWKEGAGVTIRSRGDLKLMAGRWAWASARCIATDVWILGGDLA